MSTSSKTISKFFQSPNPLHKNDVRRNNKNSLTRVQSSDYSEVWETPIGLTTDTPIEIESDEDDNAAFNHSGNKPLQLPKQKQIARHSCEKSDTNKKEKGNFVSISSSSMNPFAQFAFGIGQTESSFFRNDNGKIIEPNDDNSVENRYSGNSYKPWNSPVPTKVKLDQKSVNNENIAFMSDKLHKLSKKKKAAPFPDKVTNKKQRNNIKKKKASSSPFISIHDLSLDEKKKIQEKWHSFADSNASTETKRFQILVAARLHTQSHERTVREAMCKLRKFFSENKNEMGKQNDTNIPALSIITEASLDKELNATTLSGANPEIISNILSSILFANVKTRQIIQAAKDVQSQFNGRVPESQHGLNSIMGIGPRLADLLSFVIRHSAFTRESD